MIKCRRHYRWPRRLTVKFIMWAMYNAYVIKQSFMPDNIPKRKKTFNAFIESVCLSLVGALRQAHPKRMISEETPQRLRNIGIHHPIFPADASTNTMCAVCVKKHFQYIKANPGVSYSDNPCKQTKSAIQCSECKVFLCIKRGSTCWTDWHQKQQYWR